MHWLPGSLGSRGKEIFKPAGTFLNNYVQRSAKNYANLAKQDPGRARQNR